MFTFPPAQARAVSKDPGAAAPRRAGSASASPFVWTRETTPQKQEGQDTSSPDHPPAAKSNGEVLRAPYLNALIAKPDPLEQLPVMKNVARAVSKDPGAADPRRARAASASPIVWTRETTPQKQEGQGTSSPDHPPAVGAHGSTTPPPSPLPAAPAGSIGTEGLIIDTRSEPAPPPPVGSQGLPTQAGASAPVGIPAAKSNAEVLREHYLNALIAKRNLLEKVPVMKAFSAFDAANGLAPEQAAAKDALSVSALKPEYDAIVLLKDAIQAILDQQDDWTEKDHRPLDSDVKTARKAIAVLEKRHTPGLTPLLNAIKDLLNRFYLWIQEAKGAPKSPQVRTPPFTLSAAGHAAKLLQYAMEKEPQPKKETPGP